jgi:hypothetical protein
MTREEARVVLGVDSRALAPGLLSARQKVRSFADDVKKDARSISSSFKDVAISVASGEISMANAAKQLPGLITGFSTLGSVVGGVGIAVTALGLLINKAVNDFYDIGNKRGDPIERNRQFWKRMRKEADAERAKEKESADAHAKELAAVQADTLKNEQEAARVRERQTDGQRKVELEDKIKFLEGAIKDRNNTGLELAQDQNRLSEYRLELTKLQVKQEDESLKRQEALRGKIRDTVKHARDLATQFSQFIRSQSDTSLSEAFSIVDAERGQLDLDPLQFSEAQKDALDRVRILDRDAKQARIEGNTGLADKLSMERQGILQGMGFLSDQERNPMTKELSEVNATMKELLAKAKLEGLNVNLQNID